MRAMEDLIAPEIFADGIDFDSVEIVGANIRIPYFAYRDGGQKIIIAWIRKPVASCHPAWMAMVKRRVPSAADQTAHALN